VPNKLVDGLRLFTAWWGGGGGVYVAALPPESNPLIAAWGLRSFPPKLYVVLEGLDRDRGSDILTPHAGI
jgi:hypothetical protein